MRAVARGALLSIFGWAFIISAIMFWTIFDCFSCADGDCFPVVGRNLSYREDCAKFRNMLMHSIEYIKISRLRTNCKSIDNSSLRLIYFLGDRVAIAASFNLFWTYNVAGGATHPFISDQVLVICAENFCKQIFSGSFSAICPLRENSKNLLSGVVYGANYLNVGHEQESALSRSVCFSIVSIRLKHGPVLETINYITYDGGNGENNRKYSDSSSPSSHRPLIFLMLRVVTFGADGYLMTTAFNSAEYADDCGASLISICFVIFLFIIVIMFIIGVWFYAFAFI